MGGALGECMTDMLKQTSMLLQLDTGDIGGAAGGLSGGIGGLGGRGGGGRSQSPTRHAQRVALHSVLVWYPLRITHARTPQSR